jgi:uncharacterized phage-associated protein
MASVHDVAAAILERRGPMDTWRLQKLVYYCQAWHLVWEGRPLFPEQTEAWANGPVSRDLYRQHVGKFQVSDWPKGRSANLKPDEITTIDAVLKTYGDKSGHFLSILTHREPPWRDARIGLSEGERGNRVIPLGVMAEYYGGLVK